MLLLFFWQTLTSVLQGGPEDHSSLASRAVSGQKAARKALENCSKELAEADLEISLAKSVPYALIHRYCKSYNTQERPI
jgi:hypothetical protein